MKQTEQQNRVNYGNTFNSEIGKKVLFDLVDHSQMLSPLVVDSMVNSQVLAFREGAKSIICRILNYSGSTSDNINEIVRGVNSGR